jgi:energy-converting hydrogenase Eha subunit A
MSPTEYSNLPVYADPRKVGVLTVYSEHVKELAQLSLPGMQEYCKKMGYTFVPFTGDVLSHKKHYEREVERVISTVEYNKNDPEDYSWYKIRLILQNLHRFEYILWMDIDTLIQYPHAVLSGPDFQASAASTIFNTGVFVVKCTPTVERLLVDALHSPVRIGAEQGALQAVCTAYARDKKMTYAIDMRLQEYPLYLARDSYQLLYSTFRSFGRDAAVPLAIHFAHKLYGNFANKFEAMTAYLADKKAYYARVRG